MLHHPQESCLQFKTGIGAVAKIQISVILLTVKRHRASHIIKSAAIPLTPYCYAQSLQSWHQLLAVELSLASHTIGNSPLRSAIPQIPHMVPKNTLQCLICRTSASETHRQSQSRQPYHRRPRSLLPTSSFASPSLWSCEQQRHMKKEPHSITSAAISSSPYGCHRTPSARTLIKFKI